MPAAAVGTILGTLQVSLVAFADELGEAQMTGVLIAGLAVGWRAENGIGPALAAVGLAFKASVAPFHRTSACPTGWPAIHAMR